jgi:purine-binding chemotaxis protein CheW
VTASTFTTFLVQDLLFGIPVARAQEVIQNHEITPVPLAPPIYLGLINLRGQIVPVVDLRRVLGLPEPPRAGASTFVVLRTREGPVSLLIDDVGDVLDVPEDGVEPPPETLPGRVRRLVRGIHKLDGRLLLLLEAEEAVLTPGGEP